MNQTDPGGPNRSPARLPMRDLFWLSLWIVLKAVLVILLASKEPGRLVYAGF
jgi:hypothetical protein